MTSADAEEAPELQNAQAYVREKSTRTRGSSSSAERRGEGVVTATPSQRSDALEMSYSSFERERARYSVKNEEEN